MPSTQLTQDHLAHEINVRKHLNVGKPQHPNPVHLQKGRPSSIARRTFLCEVLATVNFDRQPLSSAEEVQDEATEFMLSAKLVAAQLTCA